MLVYFVRPELVFVLLYFFKEESDDVQPCGVVGDGSVVQVYVEQAVLFFE